MEQNLPVIAKRIWNMVRIAYFMLRKGIAKSKLMADLSSIMSKRRKIAGKAIRNLMFHHHDGSGVSVAPSRGSHDRNRLSFAVPTDYEFSCSNSPAYPNFHFPSFNKRRHHYNGKNFFGCAHAPSTQDDDMAAMNAFKAVLEMLNNEAVVDASPALPGFGRSPMVRQLRVTDSPFPLTGSGDEDPHVDKAAEEFINRFYKELRLQKTEE